MKAQIWRMPSESEFSHGYAIGFTTDDGAVLDKSIWVRLMATEELLPLFERVLKEGFKRVLGEE